ncbi:MAG: guanylate kinase [Chloroflexota bacterium]|nr:guanylate kinase [Chloroflexota bacterium]MDE2969389.1 guanylate kinase [Chloroflexota bacterium]
MTPPNDSLDFEALAAQPLMVVVSGPSGVGKDAVLLRLREREYPVHFVVTATTRPKRMDERDGYDYIFMDEDDFDRKLAEDGFLEWAVVYGNRYGVPKEQVRGALASGIDVIVKIDVQGAETIKRLNPGGVYVFLAPPSMEELERRLRARKSEAGGDLERRLDTARQEMERMPMFDYVVVNENGRLDETAEALEAIMRAERWRYPRRAMTL